MGSRDPPSGARCAPKVSPQTSTPAPRSAVCVTLMLVTFTGSGQIEKVADASGRSVDQVAAAITATNPPGALTHGPLVRIPPRAVGES